MEAKVNGLNNVSNQNIELMTKVLTALNENSKKVDVAFSNDAKKATKEAGKIAVKRHTIKTCFKSIYETADEESLQRIYDDDYKTKIAAVLSTPDEKAKKKIANAKNDTEKKRKAEGDILYDNLTVEQKKVLSIISKEKNKAEQDAAEVTVSMNGLSISPPASKSPVDEDIDEEPEEPKEPKEKPKAKRAPKGEAKPKAEKKPKKMEEQPSEDTTISAEAAEKKPKKRATKPRAKKVKADTDD